MPGLLTPQQWRRVASRVAPEWNITQADVRDMIHQSSMMRIVMNRVGNELKSGRHKPPTSQADFAAIVAASQETLTADARKAEAKALNGAFPASQAGGRPLNPHSYMIKHKNRPPRYLVYRLVFISRRDCPKPRTPRRILQVKPCKVGAAVSNHF